MSNITVELTQRELETAISGLLFSCSVNITSNTDKDYQVELLDLAKKLKAYNPDIKLNNIQFLKEDDYEDEISPEVFNSFQNNLETTTFETI